MDPLWWLIPAAIVAGFIDSMVGGGGVITLPAIIASGAPPHVALATNKVAGTGASGMATWQYARHGLIRKELWALFPIAVLASILGAVTVLNIPEDLVLAMVAIVVLVMVVYVLVRPRFGQLDNFRPMDFAKWTVITLWVAGAAFYDGLLGPGTGTILLFGLVAILGMPFVAAAAHGRIYNFGSNIGALALFAGAGLVDWRIGLGMMAGTMLGAFLGSHANIRHGTKWIKPLFVVMALALLGRIIFG